MQLDQHHPYEPNLRHGVCQRCGHAEDARHAVSGTPWHTAPVVDDCHDVRGPLAPHVHRADLGARIAD